MTSLRLSPAGALVLVAAALPPQSAPQIALGRPTATATAEFSRVIAAQELGAGKLLVADEKERKLTLVDFGAGTARPVGRVGSGPGEFRAIGGLLPRAGGGAYVTDFVLRRLLPVRPDGSLADPIPNPAGTLHMQGVDSAGRIYGNVTIFRNRALQDSMYVARWDVAAARLDTLLIFDAGRSGMIIPRGEKFRVWYATTSWTVLPDGSLIFVDAASYNVRRWAGAMTPVAALPFESRPVTSQDREAWIAAQQDVKPMALGQGAAPASAPPRPEPAFPATYPAFEADTPLRRAPDGTIWIQRLVSPRDSIPRYDVVTADGRLAGQVRLPVRASLIAFGPGALYLVERDTDDVEHVRRYPYPALPRR